MSSSSKSTGWVKKKNKDKSVEPTHLIKDIKEIVSENESLKNELILRATQMKRLCDLSATIRAMAIKIAEGKLKESDMSSIRPPKINTLKAQGCEDAFEYVKNTLSEVRPIMVSLLRSNLSLTTQIRAIESETCSTERKLLENKEIGPDSSIDYEKLLTFTDSME